MQEDAFMKPLPRTIRTAAVLAVLCVLSAASGLEAQTRSPEAEKILSTSGVKGGLVVHLNCGDGSLTAELGASGPYLVRGLERNRNDVQKARERIMSRGLYGEVSVAHWTQKGLPFTDNLVDLVVCRGELPISRDELMRVLSPEGVVCLKRDGEWITRAKPWPAEIDEWTHFLHDSSNNAVADDSRVGPPRYLQWQSPPEWCRSHEFASSIHTLVSAKGRLFGIIDEGVIGQPRGVPAQWKLVARDAFNGVLLWKRPVSRTGMRTLVASGNRLYATLKGGAPVSVLDAATGEKLDTCDGTANTREIILADGTLICRGVNKKKQRRSGGKAQFVAAVNADTGDVVWKQAEQQVKTNSLAALNGRVCYRVGNKLVCRKLATGKALWKSNCGGSAYTVMHGSVVLCSGRGGTKAFAAGSGERLWNGPPRARSVPGVFVADGLVWASWPPGTPFGGRTFAWQPMKTVRKGYDPETGKVERTVSVERLVTPGHHIRCYPPKATDRYLLLNKRGVEFLDLTGSNSMRHNWFRGPCQYGIMPANGLLYVPPNQCFCYPGVKLNGFNALSAHTGRTADDTGPEQRLHRGTAWGTDLESDDSSRDWPTYRHDPQRSGSVDYSLPARVQPHWTADLGGNISPPVAARGKIFVADIDAHSVRCLDADSGKQLWTYTTGARVDSPPTIYRGLVIFGSRDGNVYCLRASDGRLVWRFRAAPGRRRMIEDGQLESAWPSHGSVLVRDDKVYCTAGRCSYLDGGIRVYALDPRTGEVLHKRHLSNDRPDIEKNAGRPFDMQGASSDLLVAGSEDIYMFQKRFNPDLTTQPMPRITKLGDRRGKPHLMCNDGFLDKTWFNRTYWTYSDRWPGYYFAFKAPKSGQLLVFDDERTYGVQVYRHRRGHSPEFKPGTGYELFADRNTNELVLQPTAIGREKGEGFSGEQLPAWSEKIPVRVQAMVLAGSRLYVAGPPDLGPGQAALDAMRGRRGSRFRVVSADDGTELSAFDMERVPVFDGMIAAYGRLYMVTRDGAVMCLGRDKTAPRVESADAFNMNGGRIVITFSEKVDKNTATEASHYQVEPRVKIRSASLGKDGRTVGLRTSRLKKGKTYSLAVKGVKDRATAENTASDSTEFTCRQRKPGLVRSYYEGKWQQIPDFDSLEPVKKEVVKEIGAIGPRSKNHFALRFRGQLRVPYSGKYTFNLSSDDGSRLYIDGELVVDNGGVHATREKSGTTTLDSGLHSITVSYFEVTGGQDLKLKWSGPGLDRQELPWDLLYHRPRKDLE